MFDGFYLLNLKRVARAIKDVSVYAARVYLAPKSRFFSLARGCVRQFFVYLQYPFLRTTTAHKIYMCVDDV